MKEIHVSVRIEVPRVPNFLKRSDGSSFRVGDVSDDGLRELGKAWTEDLIKRAHEQRARDEEAHP